jgi:hypothetical protein
MELLSHAQFKTHFKYLTFYRPASDDRPAHMASCFVQTWLLDYHKQTCDKIVIDPTQPPGPLATVFNQFPGFKAAQLPPVPDADVEGLVQPIMRHVLDVIVAGYARKAAWFMDWLAVQVQHAQHKQIGVVVNGERGCGKSILADFFGEKVLGPRCSFHTTDAKRNVVAKFAHGVVCTVFLHVKQEVVSLGDNWDRLRHLVSDDTIFYEERHKRGGQIKNLMHVYMTTENTTENMLCWRFALFQASNVHVGDTSYFTGLRTHLARPEVARAFYQFLMARDLSQFRAFVHPPERYLSQQNVD